MVSLGLAPARQMYRQVAPAAAGDEHAKGWRPMTVRTPIISSSLSRRRVLQGAGAAGLALATTRFSGRAQSSGDLKVGMGALPPTLDPHLNASGISFATFFQLWEGLTNISAAGELEPALATEWNYIDDLTLELKLRQGVTFHNGEPFTGETVKWNVERIIDPEQRSAIRSRLSTVERVEVVDPLTVRLILKAPSAVLVRALSVAFMIPHLYFQERGGSDGFVTAPVGTGPFKYVDGAPGDFIDFAANETYWRGAPKLATVKYLAIPEGGARLAALQSGQVDMIQNVPLINVEPLRAEGYRIEEAFMSRMHVVHLMPGLNPALQDKRVRQAFNYAIDKQVIIDSIMQGHARLSQGQLVGDDGYGFNPNLAAYPYDPARARQLIAEAGVGEITLTVWATEGSYIGDRDTNQAIAGFLEDVGVKTNLQTIEFATFAERLSADKLDGLNLQGMNYFPIQDAYFVMANYGPTRSYNSIYNNPEYDEALTASVQELDPEARLALLHRCGEILHDDPPVIYLFQPPDIFAVGERVQGFAARNDARIYLLDVEVS
jgi:peptide/nickel transport system substrate-binding protein